MKFSSACGTLLPLVLAAGCGGNDEPPPLDDPEGDFEGIEEAAQGLTNLSSRCTFVTATGLMTLTLQAADVAMVSKSTSGAIVINGNPACTVTGTAAATSTNLKKLVVTGPAASDETLILDYLGGTFAPGITGAVGVDVSLGADTGDALKIRGTKGIDSYNFGASGITTNTDLFKDIAYAGVSVFVVTFSDGADVFTGAGGTTPTGAGFPTAVTVYGGAGDDVIRGGLGNDILNGGDGNDTFQTGGPYTATPDGNDTYNGGANTAAGDTVDYSTRTETGVAITVTVGGAGADGDIVATEADVVAADIENVKGGSGNDVLTADPVVAKATTLSGGPGNDTITGGGAADVLNGDAGDDSITGGAGADVYNGGAGNDTFHEGASLMASGIGDIMNGGTETDTVDYAGRSAAVVVNLDATANDGEDTELDKVVNDVENVLGGSAGNTITGSASDNVLTGGAGVDTISGGLGNDTITGGLEDDFLNGGAGDDTFNEGTLTSGADTIHGDLGIDTLSYALRTVAGVTVVMDGSVSPVFAPTPSGQGGATEGDLIYNDVENLIGTTFVDSLTGNEFDNVIEGGPAADIAIDSLFGLAGDDLLDGGGTALDSVDCGAGDADTLLDATVATATDIYAEHHCEL